MAFQGPKQHDNDNDESEDEGGGALFAEINITPLTDVILVLLIIFMVASSAMVDAMRDGMIDVNLPTASTAASEKVDADAVIIGIAMDGRIYMHDEVIDETQLFKKLEIERKKNPGAMIIVQADGELQYRKVVEVIDKLRKAGYANVGMAAEADE
ncbi:MAG: biopolymer transporter ExbD [Deltaproteobacteria bacterium]|nr:biopolymer transporter ExbD [Deltaproteobacteria bacterium]